MLRKLIFSSLSLLVLAACQSKKNITTTNNQNTNSVILIKYAEQMQISSSSLKNEPLYAYIDEWIGVKYKYGGTTKNGVDCSGFVQQVFKSVYNISLERTATSMINQCKVVGKDKLLEGDLVFFDISGKNSHVGIYLANNYFIHASTSKGVILSSLTSEYYIKNWGRGGRIN